MQIVRSAVKIGIPIMVLISVTSLSLSPLLPGNGAFIVAVAIVGGGYAGLRSYKKRHAKGKFGENLRGSEIADHTDTKS